MATQVNRLHGHYAVCHVAGTKDQAAGLLVAHLLEWECTLRTTFANATAHGDYYHVPVVIKQEWEARCAGFMTEASRISFLSAWLQGANGSYTDPAIHTFIGYNDHLTLGATDAKVLIRGNAYPSVATIRLPDKAMSNQEITFMGVGSPLFLGPGI